MAFAGFISLQAFVHMTCILIAGKKSVLRDRSLREAWFQRNLRKLESMYLGVSWEDSFASQVASTPLVGLFGLLCHAYCLHLAKLMVNRYMNSES
jgi:hypothetical protein